MENNLKSNEYNGLTLAYIGDAVYEIYIRNFIISLGYKKVNDIHKHVIEYTSALSQAKYMSLLLDKNILTDFELNLYKRGRNTHPSTTRRNVDLKIYLEATGFEALIGALYIDNNISRLEEIISLITEGGL